MRTVKVKVTCDKAQQDAERSLYFSQPTIVWIKITDLPYRCSTEVVGPP